MHSLRIVTDLAEVLIERVGQKEPSISDDVEVVVKITLPNTGTGTSCIREDLRFHSRVFLMGVALGYDWGENSTTSRRHWISARTWPEAFKRASAYAAAEVAKLEQAVAARKRALAEAEFA